MKKEEGKEKIRIMVFCNDKDHLGKLNNAIYQHSMEIARAANKPGADVSIINYLKTSDLNGTPARNLVIIVLSLIGGNADPPWDIPLLKHRFGVSVIVEVPEDFPEIKSLRVIELWNASYVFGENEDAGDFIAKALTLG